MEFAQSGVSIPGCSGVLQKIIEMRFPEGGYVGDILLEDSDIYRVACRHNNPELTMCHLAYRLKQIEREVEPENAFQLFRKLYCKPFDFKTLGGREIMSKRDKDSVVYRTLYKYIHDDDDAEYGEMELESSGGESSSDEAEDDGGEESDEQSD